MRHSSARNFIERCFGILKARWGILRDNSHYPIDLTNKIIMACCLLHNYIRQEMTIDPFENRFELDEGTGDVGGGDDDHITTVGVSTEWTTFRNNLAQISVMEKSINYCNWTITEDAKLVEALVYMVNMGGFKADNGFKSGYLQHLETALKEKIPNSGILGKPHIESRIKTMKKDWQVVYDMVNGTNTSGFGYDSSTHSVTAEPTVWDSYIQVHKEAGKWRNKIFPHCEDLCIIFEKDRAQGDKAKDFAQMEEDANNEEQFEQIEDGFEDQTTENEESSNIGSKKRKRVDVVIKGITIAANLLGENLEKAANSMNQAILGETEVQKKSFDGDS
ncbi:uncharacterized protein LOC111918668 [Lactuca sativa]|uniref:uncharacterized protein LOC111918668 n=1 Tax=Lactuca sativa TaxID=4236 RepID=UPI000CD97D61|nr:uncharacterized protein LOC111918668 [Lactuca sativa]